jgi:hypothetical protein
MEIYAQLLIRIFVFLTFDRVLFMYIENKIDKKKPVYN